VRDRQVREHLVDLVGMHIPQLQHIALQRQGQNSSILRKVIGHNFNLDVEVESGHVLEFFCVDQDLFVD
jgi:hypothetical protein